MSNQQIGEEAIFHVAREINNPEARERYLVQVCAEDDSLRNRVEALLDVHEQESNFLKSASDPESTVDQPSLGDATGQQIGPYKLLQQIGEGGFGVVYMAEQKSPVKRRVALKIIKPGMDTRQVIARFEAERQALAMMEHPNIATALDVGMTSEGRPFFVMELVKGMPITQYCDEHHLSPRERLEMFIPVCLAVQHAHQKGIIHRDIKPSNVLVAEFDNQAVPKIIDFGVAKALNQQLTEKTMFTQYGQIIGTLEYMSPEQAKVNQLDVDTRSDIYSLGVVLYELLTGTTPFDKQRLRTAAMDELLRIIREEEPPRPSVRLSSMDTLPSVAANRKTEPRKLSLALRGELDWIVMRALDKERARRYETASAFADDVRRYLGDEAVVACPPSVRYRFGKFTRRNRAAISTGLVVLGCLLAGLIGTGWEASRRMRAEESRAHAELALTSAEASEARAKLALEEANKQKEIAQKSEQMAMQQRHEANEQRQIAEQQRELAERERQRAVAAESITHKDLVQTLASRTEVLAELRDLFIDEAIIAAMNTDQPAMENAVLKAKRAGDIGVWDSTLRALLAYHRGQSQEAIRLLEPVQESGNVTAAALLAAAYGNAGGGERHQHATRALEKMTPVTPYDKLFKASASLWWKPEESVTALNTVIEQRRSLAPAHIMLAKAMVFESWETGNLATVEKAISRLTAVKQMLPNESAIVASTELIAILTAMQFAAKDDERQNKWSDDAERAKDALLSKFPQVPSPEYLGAYFYLTGDLDRAVEVMSEAHQNGAGSHSQSFLEAMLFQRGDYDELKRIDRLCPWVVLDLDVPREEVLHGSGDGHASIVRRIWFQIARYRAGGQSEALDEWNQILAAHPDLPWNCRYPLNLFTDNWDDETLLGDAHGSKTKTSHAHCCLALKYLFVEPDRDKAERHFRKSAEFGILGMDWHYWSKAFLVRLKDPAWPDWFPAEATNQSEAVGVH